MRTKNIKLTTSITFTEAFETFQAHNKARNITDKSIYDYDLIKKSILAFMGGDFILFDFTKEKLLEYIQLCQSKGNSPITINTKLTHLRAAFNFFAEHDMMYKLPIKMLKTDKPLKEVYTNAELDKLLKKPNVKKVDFDDYRNWTLINFFVGTGCRLSTAINIQMKDVNLSDNEIIFRHMKGRSQMIIPICSALKLVLLEYLRYRKATSPEDYLFPTWHNKPLTVSGLQSNIQRYNQRRGVDRTSIHSFRHTFAKLWILNGGDVFRLQKMLGHKSLDMTKRYVELFSADLKIGLDEVNPLSHLNGRKKELIKL